MGFNLQDYLSNNPLLEEKEELDKSDIPEISSELDKAGDEFADELEDELKDLDTSKLDEALDPISILSYILASTTLVNILAKYGKKLAKKYDWGKGEEAATKIYDFTYQLEEKFKSPIKFIVSKFTKDPKKANVITNALYIVLLGYLGYHAGGGALEALKKSKLLVGGLGTLKAALKGKDIVSSAQDIIQDLA
jgi:hypothetical protein